MKVKKSLFIIISIFLLICANSFANTFNEKAFFDIYQEYRTLPKNLMLMKHSHVIEEIKKIKLLNSVKIEQAGSSVENRSINVFSFGQGKTNILLWSQMHGNEPTATAALLTMYKYLADNIDDPFVQKVYKNLSIHSVIMLNPDGAERFQRRNAFDIDINRDAYKLQTPEGRVLKKMKDKLKPDFGFNLHSMGGRETVGETNKILKIALMAPPFNKANEDNPTRIRAKKVVVHIKSILDKYINGHIAKYKADYMPRAFGDAMQNWGVSTVLLETGSYTSDDPVFLEQLNFVSLLSVFNILADNKLEKVDHKLYDKIPLEGETVFDILIKNALIANGVESKAFLGDVGINVDYKLRNGKIDTVGYIKDIGDLSIYQGKKIINADQMILTPGFISQRDKIDFKGITTIVENAPDEPLKIIEKHKIKLSNIYKITSKIADENELDKLGQIKQNYKANVLLFAKYHESEIDLNKLQYIILNGEIKKMQE